MRRGRRHPLKIHSLFHRYDSFEFHAKYGLKAGAVKSHPCLNLFYTGTALSSAPLRLFSLLYHTAANASLNASYWIASAKANAL